MMALAGVGLETLVFEPDALTTRPPPCATCVYLTNLKSSPVYHAKRRQKHLQLDQFTISQQKPSPRQKQKLNFWLFYWSIHWRRNPSRPRTTRNRWRGSRCRGPVMGAPVLQIENLILEINCS